MARRLADEVLFPAAPAIDRAAVVPAHYLDLLAGAGLYGLFGPASAGGLGADALTAGRVIEALAGGSLATSFIWIQHHSVVRAVAGAPDEVRDRWLPPLCAGRVRGGIAIAALRRPGPPAMTATRVEGGWLLSGSAPWVTGWERIDVVLVAARDGDDMVWSVVDPSASVTLAVERQDLAAMASTATVTLHLDRHPVPDSRVLSVEPVDEWRERDARGLRLNGYLAIGVAARAAGLLGSAPLSAEVDRARTALDGGPDDHVVAARAGASLLASRVASALVVTGGGGSMSLDGHAQRLAREAMFLLVFGQTEPIRAEQLAALGAGAGS
jgi:alkylation response protein AidB-like acyl-CoA dehydrogenase